MSRILAIRETERDREVDYSALSLKEIQKRIKRYEKKYGSFAQKRRASFAGQGGQKKTTLILNGFLT